MMIKIPQIFILLLLYSAPTGAFAQAVNQKSKVSTGAIQKSPQLPIIDMHMHSNRENFAGPPSIPFVYM